MNSLPFLLHRRLNIRSPSAIDQALRAARPKDRPRADYCTSRLSINCLSISDIEKMNAVIRLF